MDQPDTTRPASAPASTPPPPPPPPPPPYLTPAATQAPPQPAGQHLPGAGTTSGGRKRRATKPRRLLWCLVALLATPVGIWWSVEGGLGVNEEDILEGETGVDPVSLVMMLVGLALLLLVAASARFTRAGPLLAALVWGVVPVLVYLLAPDQFTSIFEEFDEVVGDWFDDSALVVFPVVAVLMLGAAAAGRRRTQI